MQKKYVLFRVRIIITLYILIMLVISGLGIFVSNVLTTFTLVLLWLGLLLTFALVSYFFIIKPLKHVNQGFKDFYESTPKENHLEDFYYLNLEQEKMHKKLATMFAQKEAMDYYIQQTKYLALQNQMNPHFLYNTLEGIRSEALIGGLTEVAKMAEMLARFFRYTISNLKKQVKVEDELNNVHYYFEIQRFRFEDKISLELIFEEEESKVKTCQMPKLVLQPIVENAICHGIEPLVGKGKITIRFVMYQERMVITVSDNGVGIDEEKLGDLNEKLKTIYYADESVEEGGIAMINVNNRIKLIYGQEYGLYFYSKIGVGTDVEISLPNLVGDC